jgi:hypothetical protein
MEMRATKGIGKKHMQRTAWKWMSLVFLALAAVACSEVGVGDPCTPETIPVNRQGLAGFVPSESYIESSSVQCRSRLCIVYRLDNTTAGPADPRQPCRTTAPRDPVNCVTEQEVSDSVHCTCKCGGPKTAEQCECPGGFKCVEILTLGGDGIKGSYCVKPKPGM